MDSLVLVPEEPTDEIASALQAGRTASIGALWGVALSASPYAKGVTREMVEKAAEAMYEAGKVRGQSLWADTPNAIREVHREDARVCLRSLGVKVEGDND